LLPAGKEQVALVVQSSKPYTPHNGKSMNNQSFESIDRMARDLHALGVRPGGVLLVHSSLRSLSPLPGGAETAVQGLLVALGEDGTLLMPALSYEHVGPHQPVFDTRTTPACVGALPEYFRTRTGTRRSVHPTHSVCGTGSQAEALLANHHLGATPCGPNSPFSRLPQVGGQVLFIGCGLRPNTSMHAIEEHVEPPYLYAGQVEYRLIHADGSETTAKIRRHHFAGFAQRYDRLEGVMTAGLRKGRVLQADCCLLEAQEMWPAALKELRCDPFFFVEKMT
jgi:aminoglycoside 3-N-acetyltransferase